MSARGTAAQELPENQAPEVAYVYDEVLQTTTPLSGEAEAPKKGRRGGRRSSKAETPAPAPTEPEETPEEPEVDETPAEEPAADEDPGE